MQTTEPGQLTLGGIPPAVQTPAVVSNAAATDATLAIALLGALVGKAIVRDTTRGELVLEVTLQQALEHHPQALPVFAAWQVPDQGDWLATHTWASARARRITEGIDVMVTGRGIELGSHGGQAVLRVIHVTGIRAAVEIPTPQPESPHAH